MPQKTKIQWTDLTWNMVWGCEGCYLGDRCYAKSIAKRFAKNMATKEVKYMNENDNDEHWIDHYTNEISQFNQTFLSSQSYPEFSAKPLKIFANSMSDIAFWLPNWIKNLINIANKYPQHTFQVLTKFAHKLYDKMKGNNLVFPENVWLGLTVTEQWNFDDFWYLLNLTEGKYFISAEPILGYLKLNEFLFPYRLIRAVSSENRTKLGDIIDWLIIGVDTSPQRDKLIGTNTFILELIDQAKAFNIPVFVKTIDNKGKIQKDNFPAELNYREFPS